MEMNPLTFPVTQTVRLPLRDNDGEGPRFYVYDPVASGMNYRLKGSPLGKNLPLFGVVDMEEGGVIAFTTDEATAKRVREALQLQAGEI